MKKISCHVHKTGSLYLLGFFSKSDERRRPPGMFALFAFVMSANDSNSELVWPPVKRTIPVCMFISFQTVFAEHLTFRRSKLDSRDIIFPYFQLKLYFCTLDFYTFMLFGNTTWSIWETFLEEGHKLWQMDGCSFSELEETGELRNQVYALLLSLMNTFSKFSS